MAARDVKLSWSETRFAAEVGITRHIFNLSKGRADRYGANPSHGWQSHIEGAIGELVVAKVSNRYWTGDIGHLDYDGDVGSVHVRATPHPNGRLIIHDDDADDAAFVLVTGTPPLLHVCGWVRGRDAKQACYWETSTGRPAFFVPPQALRDLRNV